MKERAQGFVIITNDGYGFIRSDIIASEFGEIYISQAAIRRHRLQAGDYVEAEVRSPERNERYWSVVAILSIDSQ